MMRPFFRAFAAEARGNGSGSRLITRGLTSAVIHFEEGRLASAKEKVMTYLSNKRVAELYGKPVRMILRGFVAEVETDGMQKK